MADDTSASRVQCDSIPGTKTQFSRIGERVNSFQIVIDEFPIFQAKVAKLGVTLEYLQPSHSITGVHGKRMMHKVLEHMARSRNLLLFKVPESNDPAIDATTATQILIPTHVNLNSTNAIRVGEADTKSRPLLIILPSQQSVMQLSRNRNKIDPAYRVSTDKIKLQRNHYEAATNQLEGRIKSDEKKLMVRYINHIPMVVKIPGRMSSRAFAPSTSSQSGAMNNSLPDFSVSEN
ncbi:hypothetical protein QAD02_021029 [Eretmocerus hayati]|uniref:Uncharacterized protein n=1 Tax=Eretmocerus hayati TaxID=131215 RepID=A0ACC2PP17_9HYME|nr:hypothetical protein QAD02_021029 [Eretmocerus hayati]